MSEEKIQKWWMPIAGWEAGDRFIYKGFAKGTVLRVDERRPHRHIIVWDDQDCTASVELRRGYYEKLPTAPNRGRETKAKEHDMTAKRGRFRRMVDFLASFQYGPLNIFDVILTSAIVGSGIGCIIYRAVLAISSGT